MSIPVDIRIGVYAGVVLGFSRRLLRRVLRPSRKAIVGDPVREYEVSLCLEYRANGLRCNVAGPWKVDWSTMVRLCYIASEWTKKMPAGFGLTLPGVDCSGRMGIGELLHCAKVGQDVKREVRDAVYDCLLEIDGIGI